MGKVITICLTAVIITTILAAVACYYIDMIGENDRYMIVDAKLEGAGHVILDRRKGEVRRVRVYAVDDHGTREVLNQSISHFSTPSGSPAAAAPAPLTREQYDRVMKDLSAP